MERVLPPVRVRQWVLSFPFSLRAQLGLHDDVTLALVLDRLRYLAPGLVVIDPLKLATRSLGVAAGGGAF